MASERRLIDANKLMKAIKSFRWFGVPNTLQLMFDYLKIIIRDQPTVDAVEVEKYIELREQYDKLFLAYHELRDNFISYVCSGIPNPSPFCLNKRKGCCDRYGWCKNNDKCKGFNPAEVILDGAKMDGDGNG